MAAKFWEMGQAQVPASYVQRWEFWVSPQELPVHPQSPWDGAHHHAWQDKGCPHKGVEASQASALWVTSASGIHTSILRRNTPIMSFLSLQPNYKHF